MSDRSLRIEPGFRGVVTGITRAEWDQRTTVTMRDSSGRIMASTTFLGRGEDVPMYLQVNPTMRGWAFGPFDQGATVDVFIEYRRDGTWRPAQAILPVIVRKDPDPSSPQTYVVATYLTEDGGGSTDYDDCIMSVFQYK